MAIGPLARIAHEHNLSLRTLSRWAANYRQLGLVGLCRKTQADKDKRRMSPTLQQVIEGLARYAQLYSRVGFVHEFCALAEPEMRNLLLGGWQPLGVALPSDGLSDEEVLAAILRITDGNFRLLNRLLTQIARILAINNLRKVTPAVVEVARESLVIGTARVGGCVKTNSVAENGTNSVADNTAR